MSIHSQPSEGLSCACCWDDITTDNYVEYLPFSSSETEPNPWLPSKYCQTCVEHLLKTQWNIFVEEFKKVDCLAAFRRLLKRGPPVNLRDDQAMPCPNEVEVMTLWYMSSNEEKSAKLEGSLVGEERDKFWEEKRAFYVEEEEKEAGSVEETAV